MKEWRVVTQYLEDLLLSQKEHAEKEGLQDSLVEIDEGETDILTFFQRTNFRLFQTERVCR